MEPRFLLHSSATRKTKPTPALSTKKIGVSRSKRNHLIQCGVGILLSLLLLECLLFLGRTTHAPPLLTRSSFQSTLARNFDAASSSRAVLTIYLESPSTLADTNREPWPLRRTSKDQLRRVEFPNTALDCLRIYQDYPVDNFPVEDDPFLPWIHDYFVTRDADQVRFVAQNRRRCRTGAGMEDIMARMEPQIALFQPVPVRQDRHPNGTMTYRLWAYESATTRETRVFCRFHDLVHGNEMSATTLSVYPINYEYVNWRKHHSFMFKKSGVDINLFEFSQLLFGCPIPEMFQSALRTGRMVWLDIIPIRTPPRDKSRLLTVDHIGPVPVRSSEVFNATRVFGHHHVLPRFEDSGRIENLPVCIQPEPTARPVPLHNLVLCTWTSSNYYRRGSKTTVDDSSRRLKEWIVFHQLVGVDHIYVYDNTKLLGNSSVSPLKVIADQFPSFVSYLVWPATICNNNRPNHRNPGERSSQYAAEASCRERYGPFTEWMAFIDTDEYLVPMRNATWPIILKERKQQGVHVLKMRSSRGKPRSSYVERGTDSALCYLGGSPGRKRQVANKRDCAKTMTNVTFLRLYNCDYIKPPRPDRFARAMKQIYRPAFVLSHFVHYSTITTEIARYYKDRAGLKDKFQQKVQSWEWGDAFVDELTEGTLLHAKTVLPFENAFVDKICRLGGSGSCNVGFVCPDSTPFDDSLHRQNRFKDAQGEYCNCWVNQHVENYWLPKLEAALQKTEWRTK